MASSQPLRIALPREVVELCLEPLLFVDEGVGKAGAVKVHGTHVQRSFAPKRLDILIAGARKLNDVAMDGFEAVLHRTVGLATAKSFERYIDLCNRRLAVGSRHCPFHTCRTLVLPSQRRKLDAMKIVDRLALLPSFPFTALRVLEIDCLPVDAVEHHDVVSTGDRRGARVVGSEKARCLELLDWVGEDVARIEIGDLPALRHLGFNRMASCKRLLEALTQASPRLQSLALGHDDVIGEPEADEPETPVNAGPETPEKPVQLRVTAARDVIIAMSGRLQSLRLRGVSFARRCNDRTGTPAPVLDVLIAAQSMQLRHLCVSSPEMISADALSRCELLECLVFEPHAVGMIDVLMQQMSWTLALAELAARPRFRRLHFLNPAQPVAGLADLLRVR